MSDRSRGSSPSYTDTRRLPRKVQASSGLDPGNSALPVLPTLPDLRFEQSYLASVRGFLHELEKPAAAVRKHSEISESDYEEEHHADDGGSPKVLASRDKRGEPELWLGAMRVECLSPPYFKARFGVSLALLSVMCVLISPCKELPLLRRTRGGGVRFGAC